MKTLKLILSVSLLLLLLALLAVMIGAGGYFGVRGWALLGFLAVVGAVTVAAQFFPGKE